jgi:hypothetical protein
MLALLTKVIVTELIERMVSTRGIGGLNVVWIIWQSRGGSRRCVKKSVTE